MRKVDTVLMIGILVYSILLFYSILFSEERVIFLDASFILFNILKEDANAVQVFRFGSIATQIFPVIGSKLGLSLPFIAKGYSTWFILFYFGCFFTCTKVFSRPFYGLVLLLFNTLLVYHSFYWIMNELIQGIAIALVYFAFLSWSSRDQPTTFWFYPVSAALLFTVAFVHPLIVFPFIFIMIYLWLTKRFSTQFAFSHLGCFFIFYSIKTLFFRSAYDSTASKGLGNFIELFPQYLSPHFYAKFLNVITPSYISLLFVLTIVIIHFIIERRFFILAYVLSFFIFYFCLINISFPPSAQAFYLESLYLPLSIFVAVPFVFDVISKWNKKFTFGVLLILFSFQLFNIYRAHNEYTLRLEYMRKMLAESRDQDQKKMIIPTSKVNMDILKMNWGSPYEFWLLSTLDSDASRSIVICNEPESLQWTLEKNNSFISEWGVYPYTDFPKRYFKFNDTSKYQVVED